MESEVHLRRNNYSTKMKRNYLIEPLRERLYHFRGYQLTYADSRIIVFDEDKLLNLEPIQSPHKQVAYILDNGDVVPKNKINAEDGSDTFTLNLFNNDKRTRLETYLRIMYGMYNEDSTKEYYIRSILKELLCAGLTSASDFKAEITKFVDDNFEGWNEECSQPDGKEAQEAANNRLLDIMHMPD